MVDYPGVEPGSEAGSPCVTISDLYGLYTSDHRGTARVMYLQELPSSLASSPCGGTPIAQILRGCLHSAPPYSVRVNTLPEPPRRGQESNLLSWG